jgi:hypothetical protein
MLALESVVERDKDDRGRGKGEGCVRQRGLQGPDMEKPGQRQNDGRGQRSERNLGGEEQGGAQAGRETRRQPGSPGEEVNRSHV